MAQDGEWKERVFRWRERLKQVFYHKTATVALEGFVTHEQFSLAQAKRGKFRAMPAGTRWGGMWEYGWFRCTVAVPREAKGERIVFVPGCGSECLVFVNGRESGAASWGRSEITLAKRARGGEKFEIYLEAYAGHGPIAVYAGPLTPEMATPPEPPAAQQTTKETSFGVWLEDAYQLSIDVETLVGVLEKSADKNSLRSAEIEQGLRDFSLLIDFEQPLDAMLATCRAARKRIAPLLAAHNGTTAPELYAFGHGHLDVAWLWPLAETERKAARTFSSQLELLDEYPGHRFLQSEPHLYWMVKRLYPDLYKRIQKAVRSGQLIAEGAMWVEPDMNIAGGEALVRQCIHGKRFFREELGVECEMLWLPDVFGYSAALPQILQGCGVKYFATAKIFWNYHGGENFPHNVFTWEGIDGTTVLAHLFGGYGGDGTAGTAIDRWNGRQQKMGNKRMYFCYGHGDGGGGPTRDHVESVLRLKDLEGVPRVNVTSPVQFFKDVEKEGGPTQRYVGELYFQAHRGTYTSQARTKRGNRKSEYALREAEVWASVAAVRTGFRTPLAELDTMWKAVLLNQFHDILPGSSIARVYEEAEKSFTEVIDGAGAIASRARTALIGKGKAVTAFNSLNWPRAALVELPQGALGAEAADGTPLDCQTIDGRLHAEAAIPSLGWTTVRGVAKETAAPTRASVVKATAQGLENERLRVRFDARGRIASLFDKEADRELAAGPCNDLKLYKDIPCNWDAWDLDIGYMQLPIEQTAAAKIEVVSQGALAGIVRIVRKIGNSLVTQTVTLRRGSRRVDFHTVVDWQESHKLLKVAFPVEVHSNEALHEIQFGHVRRPNHHSRQYDEDRFEVAHHKWVALCEEGRGVAVINDSKYGVNVLGKSINLSLLRAPKAPDMHADQGRQEFTYSVFAWNGSLRDSGLVNEAYDLNIPATTAAGDGGEESVFTTDAPGVVVEAVKPAEDGSGDIVVRLYEATRTATRCTLTTTLPVKSAALCTMLEDKTLRKLPLKKGAMALEFHPFEIQTVRLGF
jgi:alpha-mannosidase